MNPKSLTHQPLPKFCRFHFPRIDSEKETVLESNEILFKGTKLKFDNTWWKVAETYWELLPDGNGIFHHVCCLAID